MDPAAPSPGAVRRAHGATPRAPRTTTVRPACRTAWCLGTNGGDLGTDLGTSGKSGGKAQDFACGTLTLRRPRFTSESCREAEALRGSGRAPRRPVSDRWPGPDPGAIGGAVGDRQEVRGRTGVPQGSVGTVAWRRLSDTTGDGWSRATGTWPRGAGAVSTVRLLGAASLSGAGRRRRPGGHRSVVVVAGHGGAASTTSMAHGSTSTSAHGSHSSSSVLWAMPNGAADGPLDPVADHVAPPPGVGWPVRAPGGPRAPAPRSRGSTRGGRAPASTPDTSPMVAVRSSRSTSDGVDSRSTAMRRTEHAGGLGHDDGGHHQGRDRVEPGGRRDDE